MNDPRSDGLSVAPRPAADRKPAYGTALVKAVSLLDVLSRHAEGLAVTELSREAGLHKGTVFKLLETLQQLRLVEKRGLVYGLGVGLVRLAQSALDQRDVVAAARHWLEWLNRETGETIHLGIEDNRQVVYVAKLESSQAIRMYSSIGKSAPLYCTGLGKALLSTYDDDALENYLSAVKRVPYTARTLIDRESLRTEIEKIRHQRFALDDGEHEDDVRCVAVPLACGSHVFGAVSISAPMYRFDETALERWLPLLQACRNRILERISPAG